MNGKVIGEEISNMLNCFNNSEDVCGLLDTLLNDHPTLQQKFFGKVVLNYIRRMAMRYEGGWYDDRNEMSVKLCYDIWEVLKENYPGVFENAKQVSLPLI